MQDGLSGRSVYHNINKEFDILKVIIEKPVPLSLFLKRRVKKLGVMKVVDQILFKIFVFPLIKKTSRKRVEQLKKDPILNENMIPHEKIMEVESINETEVIEYLQESKPDIVIVNGTRIISEAVIAAADAKFINMHMGITPAYRGVHGGYWALVQKDIQNCGVTIHYVDTGIDTGNIIFQGRITPTSDDTFVTYPLLQLIKGIPLMKHTVKSLVSDNEIETKKSNGRSNLWTHPGAIEYIINFLKYRVR